MVVLGCFAQEMAEGSQSLVTRRTSIPALSVEQVDDQWEKRRRSASMTRLPRNRAASNLR
ncbi:hypothetical protein SHIRM173S_00980 [Streptomyces hirsutus]